MIVSGCGAIVETLSPYTLESQGRIVRVSEVNVRRRSPDIHPRPDAVLTEHTAHTNDRQQRSNHGNIPTRRYAPYVSIYDRILESDNVFRAATCQLVFSLHQLTYYLNNNHGAFGNPYRTHIRDERLQEDL